MMESLRSVVLKWTEYLKSKIRIPKSKICFLKFLLFDQTGRLFGQRQPFYETSGIDECRMTNDEWWNPFSQSFYNRKNTLFDVRFWTFDVRRSLVSFL